MLRAMAAFSIVGLFGIIATINAKLTPFFYILANVLVDLNQ